MNENAAQQLAQNTLIVKNGRRYSKYDEFTNIANMVQSNTQEISEISNQVEVIDKMISDLQVLLE